MSSPPIHDEAAAPLPDATSYSVPGTLPPLAERSYLALEEKGTPWLSLKLFCRSSTDSDRFIPYLLEGDLVIGSVVLDLPKKTSIKSISVSVSLATLRSQVVSNVSTSVYRADDCLWQYNVYVCE